MKRAIVGALALTMLASCATTAYRTAATANKTEAEVKADLYDCRPSGSFAFGPIIFLLPIMAVMTAVDYSAQKSCLEAKGYRVESGEEGQEKK